MANDYAPRQFLRQADNTLLREYFSRRNELDGIDWDNTKETEVDGIYKEWQDLPEETVEAIEQEFRSIFELASVAAQAEGPVPTVPTPTVVELNVVYSGARNDGDGGAVMAW